MNRPVLSLVILGGALAGMLPYAAFLDSWMFAAAYAGGSLVVALAITIRHVPAANEPPRAGEYMHAVLGVAAFSASASYLGFMLYGFGYGLTYAIGLGSDWLKLGWRIWNPHDAAFWTSGPFTLLFGLFALSFSPVPRTLYPDVVGVVSAYDGLLRQGTLKRSIPLLLGGMVLTLLTYFFWPGSWWWGVIALFAVIVAGRESMTVASKWSPTATLGKEAVHAMQKLYGALGYNTVASPRTKDANTDIDSLLKQVDLFASRDQEALAIELKTPMRTNQAVSAADASILPIAARAISRYLSEDATSPANVKPVLVLIGRDSTEDLARLADEERMKVLSLTEDAVQEALKTEDETALRELAQRYLGESPIAVPAPSAAAGAAPSAAS